jgi:hypothetical protein
MKETGLHDVAAGSGSGDPIVFEIIDPADRHGFFFVSVFASLVGGVFAFVGVWLLLAGLAGQDPWIETNSPEMTWGEALVIGPLVLLVGCFLVFGGVTFRRYTPQRISVAPDGLIRFDMIVGRSKKLHLRDLQSIKAVDAEDVSIRLSFTNDEVALNHFGKLDIDAFVSVIRRTSPWTTIDLSELNRS